MKSRSGTIGAWCLALAVSGGASLWAQPAHRVNLAGLGELTVVLSGDEEKGIIAFSRAGDVDGDGRADFLLRYSTDERPADGRQDVVLLYGFSDPWGELDVFSPAVRKTIIRTGFTFRGVNLGISIEVPGARAVTGGHDVNGDGSPDLLVASSAESRPVGGPGPVLLLILGGPLPEVIDGSQVGLEVPGSRLFSGPDLQSDELGVVASLLPDANGDGLAEIGVLFPGFVGGAGAMYVIHGSADLPAAMDLRKVGEEVPGFVVTADREETLRLMAPLGDIDGDGLSEIGIRLTSPERNDCFAIFGGAALPPVLSARAIAPAFGIALAGFDALSGAGDMDGDGRAELLVRTDLPSNPTDAELHLLRGRRREEFPHVIESARIAVLDGVHTIVQPVDRSSPLGTRSADFAPGAGGDLDGDGRSEALFGIPLGRNVVAGPVAVVEGGAAYVVRGGRDVPPRLGADEIADELGVVIEGGDPVGKAGWAVDALGDFDGDGLGELIVAGVFTGGCQRTTDYKIWLVSGGIFDRGPLRLGLVHPTRSSIEGGEVSLLMGTGFDDTTRVLVGGEEAEVVDVLGSGLLTARMPPVLVPGEVEITVTRGEEAAMWPGRYHYTAGQTIDVSPSGERIAVIGRDHPSSSSLRDALFAGDVNGDGLQDIALREDPGSGGITLILVFSAGSREDVSLDELEAPRGVTISGPTDTSQIDRVAAGGDVNGDGFDDLLVRTRAADDPIAKWFLLLGRRDFPDAARIDDIAGVARISPGDSELAPEAMAIVADVTGDAYDDMLFTARRTGESHLYVLTGRQVIEPSIVLDDAVSSREAAHFVSDVDLAEVAGSAGDFDGDGSRDFLFGGAGLVQNGALAILYMNPFFLSGRELPLSADFFGDTAGLLVAVGHSLFSGLQFRATVVPDMDGDLRPELFLRRDDLRSCSLSPRGGEAIFLDYETIILGGADGLPEALRELYRSTAVGLPDFVPRAAGLDEGTLTLRGEASLDGLGLAMSRAGDFDGDGFEDAIVGAPGLSAGAVERTAYLVRGGADFYDKSLNELAGPSDRVIQLLGGEAPGFGRHVSGGADWDGDGADDVLVAGDDGRAFVIFGSASVRTFIRGDTNLDGDVNLSDAVLTLAYLFQGEGPLLSCLDAADADDDGSVTLTDAIYTLGFLFGAGPPPPAPYPDPGEDPTADALECSG